MATGAPGDYGDTPGYGANNYPQNDGGGMGGFMSGLGGLGGLIGGPWGMALGALLPGIVGLFRHKHSPADYFNQAYSTLGKNLGGAQFGQDLNSLYSRYANSPMAAAATRNMVMGNQAMQGSMRTSLGERGLGSSGIGSVAPALAQGMLGGQMANFQGGLYNQAAGDMKDLYAQRVGLAGRMVPQGQYGAQYQDPWGEFFNNLSRYIQMYGNRSNTNQQQTR
jgi:hypothetical protein